MDVVDSAPLGLMACFDASAAGMMIIEMRVMITMKQTRRCIGIIGSDSNIIFLLN